MNSDELKQKVRSYRQQNGEETKSKRPKTSDELKQEVKQYRFQEDVRNVDQDYIDIFSKSVNDFFSSVQGEVGWDNAGSMYQDSQRKMKDLDYRRLVINGWLASNKDSLDADYYKAMAEGMGQFTSDSNKIMSWLSEAKDYYDKDKNQDAYLAYVDHQNKMGYDLDAGQKKIDDLNRAISLRKDIQAIDHDVPTDITSEYEALLETYGWAEDDDLNDLLTAETLMYNQSKLVQDEARLSSVVDSPDFAKYSQMGADIQNPSYKDANGWAYIFGWRPGAEDVKNKVAFARDNADTLMAEKFSADGNASTPYVVDPIYRHMTDDEVAIYNYYLAKEGEEKADEYLDSIRDTLNRREAGEEFARYEGRTGLEIMYGATAGADQFRSGMTSLWDSMFGDSEYIPPSSIQYAGQAMRQDLEDNGPKVFGSSLGQVGYDALSTTANMAPSILASIAVGAVSKTAGTVVGNTLLGASAAGNAYQEKLNLGYSKEQARTYGLMVGASEIAMEKILGGITALGGGTISKAVLSNLDKVDNVLARVAKSTGGKILMNAGSEALEEGLQSILEPYIWQAVSGEDASVDWQEALYSSLLGFVTGGVFEGANASFETVARNNATKQQYGAVQGEIVSEALEIDPSSNFAQKMQSRLDNGKDLSGRQINKLFKTNESGLVKNDIASIQKAAEAVLVKYGETGDVKVISEALAKQAAGKSLTRAEKAAISESKYGQRVANELNPENIQSGDFNTAWAESIDTNRINVEEYSRLVQDAELDVADTAPESTVQSGTSAVNPLRTGETNGTDSTISEGVQESSPVADTSASLEEASRKYGAQAKAMVATYNQGQDVAMFDSAYSVAYEMGKSGVGMEYAVNSEATRYLTQAQRELAYRQGSFAGTSVAKSLDAKYNGNGTGNSARKRGAVKLEGIKASEFKKMLKDSKDPRGKAAKALMTIAEVTGIDIVLFKSELDASGRYVGEQGKFVWKDDTIYIDLNAGLSYGSDAGELTKYAMLRTFGHEFTHFMEKNAANQYTEFRKLVFAEMTKKGENVDYLIKRKQLQYKDEKLSYEAASREVVADAMGDILRDSNFVENLAQKHNGLFKTLLDQFKRFIRNIRSYFNSLADNPSPEAKALKEELNGTMKYLDSIVEMFDKVAMDAVENYQQRVAGDDVVSELTPGEEGVVVAEDGEPVAYSTEDGTVMLSIRTYEEEGRSAFRTYLEKCVKNKSMTETEMTEMLDGIEEVYNICKKFKDQYAPFSAWSDAEVIRDTHGKPVFSVVTPNGEYKMNLDFSLVCKKRRALDAVLNEMCKRGIIDNFELGPKTIVKINELIRKNKLETACSLCFVDAKRFRQADVADSVVRLYNELVQSLVPEEHSRSIDHFNFAGYRNITPTENGIHTWPNSKLDFSHINEVLKQYGKNTVEAKAARYIKNNPEGRRLLLRGDFMSSSGFDAVKTRNPNIMKIYNSKKGTGGPKAAFGDVQYMNEIISNNKSWTPEKAYDVGGVRIQSFSDYVPRMVFDYVQMVYDLAAKKLPAHAYTKEALFVMQFGLTGIKINMSLIPAIVEGGIAPGLDANGKYAWAGESFDFEIAKKIQSTEGYTKNCGTIAVGVSYEHIMKLLEDPDIRMVIPYHKSSLNPIVAHMNRIGEYTDYTKPGKTPVEHGGQRTTDKNGKTIEHEFNFAKALHEVGDPKAVADQYLAWCDKEGYTPKFDEFREHENYYKLLTDFTVYDESGNYVPQREVKATFPKEGNTFGSMEKLIQSGLEEDAFIQNERDSRIPKIVDEIERTISRTEAGISDDEQVEQADHDVEAELMDENRVQKSIRSYDSVEEMDSDYLDAVDSEDVETQNQMVAEAAKRAMPDTVVVDTKGEPMLMYHGTANGGAFTVFEGNKLSNESRTSQIGQGFYFTNSKADAEAYTKNVDIYGRVGKGSNPHLHQVYLNITNPFDVRNDTLDLDKVKSVYMDGGYDYFYNNWIPFYLDKKIVNGRTFTKADLKAMSREERVSAFVDYYSKFGAKEVLSNMVRAFGSQNQGALLESMKARLGYDGIVEEYKPGLFQYVAFSSEQIKSADPVTYDDGNVIPLSERFNEENNDIRYQLRTNTLTDHEILDMAAKELDTAKLTDGEKAALEIFRKKNDALKALKDERQKQGSLYYQYQFGDQKDTAKATAARNRMTVLDGKITKAYAEVLGIEDKKVLKDVLQKSRKVIEQTERKASLNAIRAAREETRARERARADERIEALRQKKNERIAEVRAEEREKASERVQNVREGYKSSRLREKIKAFKAKLEKNLLNPTERQYVPAGLTQAMIDVVNLIDIDTDLINEDGTVNKAQERRNETKMKLSDLAAEYERLKSSDPVYAGEFDEAVYNYLTELRDNFAGRHLREMTLGELTEMYEILRSIEETLQDARKLIGWGSAETVYEAGESIIAEQANITAKRKDGKRTAAQEKRDNSLALTLSPVRFVERMAGYNQNSYLLKMFRAFEKGVRKKNLFAMRAYKEFESLTSRKQFEDAVYNPVGNVYTDANGRSFRLSKMQMMQAILSLEREQANGMSHIAGSGFSFADLDMLRKGKLKEAISEEHSHRVPNAVDMVGEFIDLLKNDKWAHDYMAAARKFFNETAKDAVNETSLILKHRIIAKDKRYIPFEVDRNFIVNEISAANDVQQTINSYGMLKDTKQFASNPLIITGLNNVLDRHIEQVGNVYGLAIEIRNFNKVWNVRGLEANSSDPTVKATIQRNWGDKGKDLVERAVQDIQGPRINNQSDWYRKIKSGYIGATFLLNLSVVTKQIGSMYSATSMLKWRGPVRQLGNLLYTMTHSKKLSAEVDKYTATAWMRRQGMSDAEIYTMMTEGKRSWLGRFTAKWPAALNPTKWITAMDHAVALSLWKYAKEDTAKRTGLKGEALLEATADFYDQVIENTQSMTDMLHRPEIQKRNDVISESFGMFKTDLYQTAGQLLNTWERNQALHTKETRQALGRTLYSVTMSVVWAQLMTSVFALLRYKVNQYRDDEDKDLTVGSWMKRQSFSFLGDIAGYLFPLFGSEIVGAIENAVYGESGNLVDSIGLTAINNAYDGIIKVCGPLAKGELPETSEMRKVTGNVLQMLGVPANNVLRTLDAIQLHAKDIANGKFLSFEAGVQRSSANHAHRIMEAVRKGDMDLANALFEEAVEEAALKKSEDGSISDQALKDAQSALQTAFGKKYKDGEISAEQAEQILVDLFGKSEDDAYWTIKAWDNGGDSRYSAVFDAALSGTGFNEAVKEMTDHGYEKEDILSKLKTQVKTWYTDEESEVRISKQQATEMLKKYAGMKPDEVTSTINQWSCKVVTGIAYEDIKDEFLAGKITASRAIDMRVRYGGKSREDAQKEVEGWNFEKKYGFSYSDRKNAYINGEVSASQLRTAMTTYGGMTAEEADENIRAYDWLKSHPKYDLSVSDVIAYTKPIADIGKSIEQAGINPDVYMQYKDLRSKCKGVDANGDGKTDSGSVKTEVLKAIDSLPISSSQKDALYYLNGWAKSKLWEAPWH